MSKIFRKKGKRKGADKSQANDKTADLLVDKEEQGIFKGGATSPDLNNKTADLLVDKEKQEKSPDLNVYQSRKTLAQGMMDLALLSANANQLRHVLETETKSAYFFYQFIFNFVEHHIPDWRRRRTYMELQIRYQKRGGYLSCEQN
ncbi:uncharacterized protein LOC132789189 [Drosophila nasuta]|uniref:uncharacterized protein LOC132789189 n=1 Tax=Drosophila nasuta TaxID=42062 RepID=UPI00295F3775|nr:uncharacterized protein LOC132789189 [Drosophila nasuta]